MSYKSMRVVRTDSSGPLLLIELAVALVNYMSPCAVEELEATDALLGTLLAKLPVGAKPDYWFMTQRSREQLRASRTATNPTGAPAPLPTDAFGIPIMVTDSLLNTEALTL